ncbi:Uncharacterised protein [uncultured archaeon]|nr:Uncharacterised protein [uncultured archaeon]
MKPFDIAVYAIVAVALIVLLFTVFSQLNPIQNNTQLLKQYLGEAQIQTMTGKTVSLGAVLYKNGELFNSKDLEERNTLVAFECVNERDCCTKSSDMRKDENCSKAIEWDSTYAIIKQGKKITTSVRCNRLEGLPVCKIYLAGLPAQTKIDKISIIDASLGVGEIKVTVTDTGSVPIASATNSVRLYKRDGNGWMLTDYIIEPKSLDILMPQEKHEFFWSINPANSGEYRAEFVFEAQNGGSDTNSIIFTLDKMQFCKTTDGVETVAGGEPDTFWEIHNCTGCTYAYECAAAWNAKAGKQFNILSADKAYCVKTTEEGAC